MKHERISIDPTVMMGKPCIKGTRMPVEQVLRELGGGMSNEEILDAHPTLNPEDIPAVINYAADVVRQTWLLTKSVLLGEVDDAIPS